MENNKKRRILALIGVGLLLFLFLLTIYFLLIGNMPMAVTMIAINALVLFITYFSVRFTSNVEEMNPELFPTDDDNDDNDDN